MLGNILGFLIIGGIFLIAFGPAFFSFEDYPSDEECLEWDRENLIETIYPEIESPSPNYQNEILDITPHDNYPVLCSPEEFEGD
jgi:hypothetical protein